jgi:hypothetical protein
MRVKMRSITKTLALLALVLVALYAAGPASAQAPSDEAETIDWQELETNHFLIVYAERVHLAGQEIACACGVEQAQVYADFADSVYAELTDVFSAELDTPISLYLFPTESSYFEVNPLAERLSGVIAHAANSRQEIAVALPRTQGLSHERLVNNIRHEVTHLFAANLSDGKLTTGFQEGIAQYLEKPTADASYEPAVLNLAEQEGRLLTWAELDEVQEVYGDPQVAYPQTLSIVSFLVDRYGFPMLVGFIKAAAEEPGYRSALEAVYEKPADELEQEWLAYLPEYFGGRWQVNAIYAYDLRRVGELVDAGAYSGAQAELEEIVALLETTDQNETLARAEALLARAHLGQTAAALAQEARQALQASDYSTTAEKAKAALAAYNEIGYRERFPEIEDYIRRAGLGQQALEQLNRGERLLESLRFSDAQTHIYEATALLQSLGDEASARQGEALLSELVRRERIVAYGLMAIGLATLFFNALRRAIRRMRPYPFEVDWL